MQIRQLTIRRFRGIEHTTLHPGPRTVLLGPNNAAKSTILEALDIVLHRGDCLIGRKRRTSLVEALPAGSARATSGLVDARPDGSFI